MKWYLTSGPLAGGWTCWVPPTTIRPSDCIFAGLLNCEFGIVRPQGPECAPGSLSRAGEPFQPSPRPGGGDQVALAPVEAERVGDRGPGVGRPPGGGEHEGQLEQGVAVLVEEVGPRRQGDRRAGQLFGLGQLPAGG